MTTTWTRSAPRRRRALLVALLLVTTACAGAGGGASEDPLTASTDGATADGATAAAEGVTNVRMVLWPGPEGDAMQEVVDAYNAGQGQEDGIAVEMVLLSRDDTFARQATEIGSQSSNVDVYFVASYNVGFFAEGLSSLADLPLDEADYFDVAVEGLQVDGELYAVPLDVSNHFLYYRSDLIDQLLSDGAWQDTYRTISQEVLGEARDPRHPDEWEIDDYLAAAAFFSRSANPDSPTEYGTALQLKTSPFNITLWDDLLWGLGGGWVDDSGAATLDSAEAIQVTDVYRTIYEQEYTSPDASQAEYGETNAALQSGDTAFALQWSSATGELTDPEASPEIADTIALAPVPGAPHRTHVHALAVSLNRHSENPEAATTWLSYLATPEAMDAYAKAGGIPSMPQVLEDNVDVNAAFPDITAHIDEFGYSPPVFSGTFEAMTGLTEELSPAWLGLEEPAAAQASAQERLQTLLDG